MGWHERTQSKNPAPDPIFYLAGGPGGSAVEDGARQQFPGSLSQNHDLVFVDQRGTGGSNRVLVPTDSPDPTGLAPEEADARARAWVAGFLGEIEMDPRYYTTAIAMDDLAVARRRDPKIIGWIGIGQRANRRMGRLISGTASCLITGDRARWMFGFARQRTST